MIDLYWWGTPNGYKMTLFMAESGLPHRVIPVNIGKGEQFAPDYLRISPNNKMPAMVDHEPADGGEPIALFESGAMLLYLADKIGRFIPQDLRGRLEVTKWLFWQVGGLGPMGGQAGHFRVYAPEKVPYAIDRYTKEVNRLHGVLDELLADREFMAGGDYTIADMATYPWVVPYEAQGQDLAEHPNLKRWFDAVAARPATVRAYADAKNVYAPSKPISDAERAVLFGQTSRKG